ncbi:MAG: M23 family metallopeptidase [Treponema sp.]|nr:M23 family metallopeptidase [Treponema sp.]
MWILPALVVLVLVPSTVSRILSYSESFARAVRFESTADLSIAYLENAMNDFAVDRNGYYDKDGNVIGSDAVKNFKQPVTYSNYTVRAGDTISGISRRFGLSNISTLIAVNGISNVRSLRTGQKLRVPSMDGLVHEVTKGESLGSISRRYGASVADILDVNDLSSEVIQAGDRLFIPGARLDSESLQKAMGELFSYPIKSSWRLTSRFGRRADPFTGVSSNHTGVDMACPTGTSIYSAMSGTVAYTGYSSVFGNYAIIKHADGYQTLYGHMSKILCKKGQRVTQGSVIGLVGSTGYSTGPHLHFTVYKNGKLVDPLTVLK